MKRIFQILAATAVTTALAGAARAGTVSGTGLNSTNSNMLYLAGGSGSATYDSSSGGFAHLTTGPTGDLSVNQALVGVIGPFGAVRNTTMSFTVTNESGNPEEPYAAFKLFGDGGSGSPLLVISLSNTHDLTSTTPIHVYDQSTGLEAVNTTWGETLSDLYDQKFSNGTAYGDMTVQRGYVYIGNWADTGTKTADITSITVDSVSVAPLPGSASCGLALLGCIAVIGTTRRLRPRVA